MKWLTPALAAICAACHSPSPSIDASVDASVACDGDAGVTINWSVSDAKTVLLYDGDEPSLAQMSGSRTFNRDRTRLVRIAAVNGDSTTWNVTRIERCVEQRVGGRGHILQADETPAAFQELRVAGGSVFSDDAGVFAIPDGAEPYDVAYAIPYGDPVTNTTYVSIEGVTTAHPIVRTTLGSKSRMASLLIHVRSTVGKLEVAHFTNVGIQFGGASTGDGTAALSDDLFIPAVHWQGPPSIRATAVGTRYFDRGLLTDNNANLPVIEGVSDPVDFELHEDMLNEVDVTINAKPPEFAQLYMPNEFAVGTTFYSYGAAGSGVLYIARVPLVFMIPVLRNTNWVVSEPTPVPEAHLNAGARGSGEFPISEDGAIYAAMYQPARVTTPTLPYSEPILRWDMPNNPACKLHFWRVGGQEDSLVYAVGSADLRKLGLYFGVSYNYTLDCYPELATVDDLLSDERGYNYANGLGRRARVSTEGTFQINY